MNDPDYEYIEQRLRRLIAATPGEHITRGFWVGDKAEERRVADNLRSGALEWQAAREGAMHALDALQAGEVEIAELGLRNAEGLRAAAMEKRLKPSQYAPLQRNAELRGRTTEASRDERLAAAVEKQERQGLKGKEARAAAIKADPFLYASFKTVTDAGIRAAIRRARKAKL